MNTYKQLSIVSSLLRRSLARMHLRMQANTIHLQQEPFPELTSSFLSDSLCTTSSRQSASA